MLYTCSQICFRSIPLYLEVGRRLVKPRVLVYASNFSLLVRIVLGLKNICLLSREALMVKLIHVRLWECSCCFVAGAVTEAGVGPL